MPTQIRCKKLATKHEAGGNPLGAFRNKDDPNYRKHRN